MVKEEEIVIDTSKITSEGGGDDKALKNFDEKLFEDESKFQELEAEEGEKFKESGKEKGASAWPLLFQLIIGSIMIVLFFGPASTYISPFFEGFGIDLGLLKWPISFVVFDVMGIPIFLIAILMWDLYSGGGRVAATINFFEEFPWFVDRLPFIEGRLSFLGTEYVGPLVSSFFDLVKEMIVPPEAFLKIGIVAMAICQRVEGELVCAGLDSAVKIFGRELALIGRIPNRMPIYLIIIWIIFSIIVSIPKFLHGLVVLLKVLVHFFFTVLKWTIKMIFKIFNWILTQILKLSFKLHLDNVIGTIKKIIERLYLLLQKLITKIDKISVYLVDVVIGTMITTLGNALSSVVKVPIIYLPIIAGRLLTLFFLIFFGIEDLGLSIFAVGLLFTIDAVGLSTMIPLVIGVIVMIIGAFMMGII